MIVKCTDSPVLPWFQSTGPPPLPLFRSLAFGAGALTLWA